jgi:integrase
MYMSLFRVTTTYHVDPSTGRRCAASTPGASKRRRESGKWYGYVAGKKTPLHRSRSASLRMLARLREEADGGDGSKAKRMRKKPLAEHLAEYEAVLRAGRRGGRRPTDRVVSDYLAMLRRWLDGTGWTLPADIDEESAAAWVESLRRDAERPRVEDRTYTRREVARLLGCTAQGVSARVGRLGLAVVGRLHATRYPASTVRELVRRGRRARGIGGVMARHLTTALRRFSRWVARRCNRPDPLAEFRVCGTDDVRRHARRAMTRDEADRLLAAARSAVTRRGLSGEDRAVLYLVALGTGFRRAELASLTPESFDLGPSPTATLAARHEKSRRGCVQPIPPHLAAALRAWLPARTRGVPLWDAPGWRGYGNAASMLRADLKAAGVPYVAKGPDGPTHLDFHALRHTYIRWMKDAGIPLTTAMELARHKDPRLTAAVYGRSGADQLAAAAGSICLPGWLPDDPSSGVAGGNESREGDNT